MEPAPRCSSGAPHVWSSLSEAVSPVWMGRHDRMVASSSAEIQVCSSSNRWSGTVQIAGLVWLDRTAGVRTPAHALVARAHGSLARGSLRSPLARSATLPLVVPAAGRSSRVPRSSLCSDRALGARLAPCSRLQCLLTAAPPPVARAAGPQAPRGFRRRASWGGRPASPTAACRRSDAATRAAPSDVPPCVGWPASHRRRLNS
jgi:hypothetical protein